MKRKVGVSVQKNINTMKWIKPEEFENLTKMIEHEQRTSLSLNICKVLKNITQQFNHDILSHFETKIFFKMCLIDMVSS